MEMATNRLSAAARSKLMFRGVLQMPGLPCHDVSSDLEKKRLHRAPAPGGNPAMTGELKRRVDERIAEWRVILDRVSETESSVLAFGRRDGQPVVLKVVRGHGDEWRSGDILEAFEGKGVVRALEHTGGAVLLEHLRPGTSLNSLARSGADDEATAILADVIAAMAPRAASYAVATVSDWGRSFDRYKAARDSSIPAQLVRDAHRLYSRLCSTQAAPRLLHGDLHHGNVLFDAERGWLAIDPKGVLGEAEYEIGAALRNPYEELGALANVQAIERRVERFHQRLGVDVERTLQWAFAQAVLAALWAIEDGAVVGPDSGWIALANAIQPMITARSSSRPLPAL
jgi:streptomycin 6-kinase